MVSGISAGSDCRLQSLREWFPFVGVVPGFGRILPLSKRLNAMAIDWNFLTASQGVLTR